MLSPHGGPYATGADIYTIYWNFTNQMADAFAFNAFFDDVQRTMADPAAATNTVYGVIYRDYAFGAAHPSVPNGSVDYDNNTFPTSGCTVSGYSVCLSQSEIQAEIENQRIALGWPTGAQAEFFLFLPSGVATCMSGGGCFPTTFCGYHADYHGSTGAVIFAVIPDLAGIKNCDTGERPNANNTTVGYNDADATISTVSHEQSEMLSDAYPGVGWFFDIFKTSWFHDVGYEGSIEVADACAPAADSQAFGPKRSWGGMAGAYYNQTFDTAPLQGAPSHYFLQSEWDNQTNGCVLHG